MRGKLAFITGATSGIGRACAESLARQGVNLIITGRRADRLNEIRNKLTKENGVSVTALNFDIANLQECETAVQQISTTGIDILINNAGLALGTEPLQTGRIDHWEQMIDTNVKGLLYITRLLLSQIIEKKGHIVNLGSTAGRWTYPGGGVYCATKFAVRALSEGLRLDLMGKGVRVTNIEPGMVETEFSDVRYQGDKDKAAAVYKNVEALSAADIAETVTWCLSRPARVNIQELVIFPTDQAGVGPSYTHRHT